MYGVFIIFVVCSSDCSLAGVFQTTKLKTQACMKKSSQPTTALVQCMKEVVSKCSSAECCDTQMYVCYMTMIMSM